MPVQEESGDGEGLLEPIAEPPPHGMRRLADGDRRGPTERIFAPPKVLLEVCLGRDWAYTSAHTVVRYSRGRITRVALCIGASRREYNRIFRRCYGVLW